MKNGLCFSNLSGIRTCAVGQTCVPNRRMTLMIALLDASLTLNYFNCTISEKVCLLLLFMKRMIKFRNEKWNDKCDGKRVTMWDNTNINLKFKLTASHVQRSTLSTYYGSNCAKGGGRKHLCAQQRGVDLWTGGVNDTEYFIGELKINLINENDVNADVTNNPLHNMALLDLQQFFQESDLVDGKLIKFLNYLDKGCRVTREIYAHNQKVVQPIYVNNKL